ncbi:EamA family transporter [Nocardioides albidus]|uniref:EamA family transporter n=2 Tax=Nocardioides albidus TaxID=1517589 RepID=A0A5C4VVI3_9ACTN|nr:EamA family transporter [Nocardioides albidus]
MVSVQLSSALSMPLIEEAGPAGTAWLRLSLGAVVFLAIGGARLRGIRRADLPVLFALGATTGLMTVAFLAAIERIPLGTTVAIEFLGPLTVAAVRSSSRRTLAWPALALAGVVVLTQPWHGEVNAPGVAFAVLAAVGWGGYILLTQRVGDRYAGVTGLAVTIPVAAVATAVVGLPQAAPHLTVDALAWAALLALLMPVLPMALEMLALRRMTHTAFGTLMALEPGFGALLGFAILDQALSPAQVAGISLVVIAGAAAQLGGRREDAPALSPAAEVSVG